MFIRNIFFAVLLFTGFQAAFAQTTENDKPKGVTEELRKEAVELLRETNVEVGTLRSLENRISFASEMAGLMWFYDDKQATAMYQTVITDFKTLLTDYDSQMNTLGIKPDETEYRESLFSGDQDDKTRLVQKIYKALGVRQQIAMSLAEHDPTLAYDFFYDTLSIISNAEFRKTVEQRDTYFESQFLKQIALKDPAKAVEFGRKSLAKGVSWTHVDLLQKIYEKDAEKGAEFADDIVGKYKSDKAAAGNLDNLVSFLRIGAANSEEVKKKGGKKPMFTEQGLRDLSEILAQKILEKKDVSQMYDLNGYLALIEKYAPNRAVQIRAKFPTATKPPKAVVETEEPVEREMSTVPEKTQMEAEMKARQEKEALARKEQEEMAKNVQKLGDKELPKEEREKIIEQSRKIIGGMGNRQEKILALGALASQVSALGDKELAADIMKDAQALVNPSPKNYKDFIETWFLASAYAKSDPDKAFVILEDSILRLNDTLSAFIKVGEFMDISGEMIDDGEVQVGGFGGSFINGLTRELGIADSTIRSLAIADFGKTKALTNRFERTEVRILAKMLVLRAVLGDGKMPQDKPRTDQADVVLDGVDDSN